MTYKQAKDYFEKVLKDGHVYADEEFIESVECAIRAISFADELSSALSEGAAMFRGPYKMEFEIDEIDEEDKDEY